MKNCYLHGTFRQSHCPVCGFKDDNGKELLLQLIEKRKRTIALLQKEIEELEKELLAP